MKLHHSPLLLLALLNAGTSDNHVQAFLHQSRHNGRLQRVSPLFVSQQQQQLPKQQKLRLRKLQPGNNNNNNNGRRKNSYQPSNTPPPTKTRVNRATIEFNNRLNKMSKNYDKITAPRVQELLDGALQTYQRAVETGQLVAGNRNDIESLIQPNVVSFTAALNAWSRCSRPDAAEKAQALLEKMIELSTAHGYTELHPNLFSFYAVLTAWNRCRQPHAAERAQQILRILWSRYEATADPDLKPTARTYNTVINAIARSRKPNCADDAVALLNEMEDLFTQGDHDMQPDALTFGAIINAYANEQSRSSTDKAIQILQRMESLYQLGYESVRPNTFVYNSCMNAFAKTASQVAMSEAQELATIEKSGDVSDQDNLSSSLSTAATDSILSDEATVLTQITTTNADTASQILRWMESQYHEHANTHVKPDVISYSTCINAYANSVGSIEAGPRATALLERMTQYHILSGDDEWKPNAIVATAVLKAWLTSVHAANDNELSAEKSQIVFQEAAQRCRMLLTQMCLLLRQGDRRNQPTKVTLDTAMDIMAAAGDDEGVVYIKKLQASVLSR